MLGFSVWGSGFRVWGLYKGSGSSIFGLVGLELVKRKELYASVTVEFDIKVDGVCES